MTYEQAGGGIAGLGIENNEAIILSLIDPMNIIYNRYFNCRDRYYK